MTRFRLQNYKNVEDTGWVNCGQLTVFVGKNEVGKSAIFRGLSKLNPSDKEEYNGLKEFPRRRYTVDFRKYDWPVSSVEFQLSDDELKELSQTCSALKNVSSIICTRYYSQELVIHFRPEPKLPDISNKRFLGLLRQWHSILEKTAAPEGKAEQLVTIKKALLPFLSNKIQQLSQTDEDDTVEASLADEVSNTIMSNFAEQWQMSKFKGIIDGIREFKDAQQVDAQLAKSYEWVENKIPMFIYFEEYDVIDSAVHFPTFIQKLNQTPSAPRIRTTKCLFEHVGLDVKTIHALDPNQPDKVVEELRTLADERAIRMSSASAAMTKMFSEWWEQRQHQFRYQVDGPFFRVWVSDNLDPSEIELDQRSRGMQYFFSFYLVFLVEASNAHRNAILLLDEPGLHVHGTAQQKIVKFLEKLSEQNQLLYSTHSPFMIDGDHLEKIRVVYEDMEDGTAKISEDVWPKDEDSLFPLQAGLGYALAQTLFYSKRQLVVEGITDYSILKAVNNVLSEKGMTFLRRDAVIVPSGGVNNLLPLASMLIGHQIKIAVLLDGDEPGRRKGKQVETRLLVKCLFTSTYADKREAELEDLFPENVYLDAVKEAYPDVQMPISFTKEEKGIQCITKRVKAAFERMGNDFEKWRPLRVLLDRIQENPDILTEETLVRFESIFKEVNKRLK
jgi:hypothetical protein